LTLFFFLLNCSFFIVLKEKRQIELRPFEDLT